MGKKPHQIEIFTETECLSYTDLIGYTQGKISKVRMRELEQHLSDCKLCSDAYDGFSEIENPKIVRNFIYQINDHVRNDTGIKSSQVLAGYYKEIAIGLISIFIIVSGGFLISTLDFRNAEQLFADKNRESLKASGQIHAKSEINEKIFFSSEEALIDNKPLDKETEAEKETDSLTNRNSMEITVRKKEIDQNLRTTGDASNRNPDPNKYIVPNKKNVNYSRGYVGSRESAQVAIERYQQKLVAQKEAKQKSLEKESEVSTTDSKPSEIPIQQNSVDEHKVYSIADVMPQFPGGNSALNDYLFFNKKYPKKAESEGIEGNVTVGFIVDVNGKITDINILNSVEKNLDKEALRLVKNMPDWEPGKIQNTNVKVKKAVTINFSL